MSQNLHRKRCSKCNISAAENKDLTFHRFPLPGKQGLSRLRVWAEFCYPDQDWSSEKSLKDLHYRNKVICSKHFNDSCYTNSSRTRLNMFATPIRTEDLSEEDRQKQTLRKTGNDSNISVDKPQLPNDMENYMEYHVMGSVSQIRMKPDALPTKFECQPFLIKKRNEHRNRPIRSATSASPVPILPIDISGVALDMDGITETPQKALKKADKSIQVHLKSNCRSKATQSGTNVVSQGVSSMKTMCRNVTTSPISFELDVMENNVELVKRQDKTLFIKNSLPPDCLPLKQEQDEMDIGETSVAFANISNSDTTTESRTKVTAEQTSILCNFFEENPEIIRGYSRSQKCIEMVQMKWKNITPDLNAVGPPKDHRSWAKYLCDMKAKLKRKSIKWKQSCDGKNPIMCNTDDFNEIRLRMLQVLRNDATKSLETQESHTPDLQAEDDNYHHDYTNEGDNYTMDTLEEEIPDVRPKLECLNHNDIVINYSPPPDLEQRQMAFDDEFDLFGKNVAQQLRTLPLLVALETQEMLLSVLKKQRLKMHISSDPLSSI